MTEPSASTASIPTTCARVMPWAMTWIPPALVATVPPMVAESRAARSTPYRQPASTAWRCNSPKVAPAPTVTCPESSSTSPSSVSRNSEMITGGWPPLAAGTDPPTRPVLPPWGKTGTPAAAQARKTWEISSTEPGRTTARHGPPKRRVQSVTKGATRSSPIYT